jgi:hypothetical protein
MEWRTSTYSSGGGGQCVETASRDGLVMIRDSTSRNTMTLAVSAVAWTAFTASLRSHS